VDVDVQLRVVDHRRQFEVLWLLFEGGVDWSQGETAEDFTGLGKLLI
jgi:hypothetical protein